MTKGTIPESIQRSLEDFVSAKKRPALIETYLHYVESVFQLQPILFVKDKMVFQSLDDAIKILGEEEKLWRETEIKVHYAQSAVNELTTKIYICPFTGKVFGNNTHPNPQDAIYTWVSTCPENTERVGGLRAKRFFISEDPEVILQYAKKCETKAPVTKTVFSSVVNGKLFHSKEAVIDDFCAHYVKRISLVDVQRERRFHIEEHFMKLIEEQLQEDKIATFVETLSELPVFVPYVEQWLGAMEHEG